MPVISHLGKQKGQERAKGAKSFCFFVIFALLITKQLRKA
jgi:hypothetical protein